jgi:SNF2 family DNA or RNA helicase
MIKSRAVTITSQWLDNEKAFFLYGNIPFIHWRHLAFSWHKESFYGTFLQTKQIDGHEGVLLSPWQALTFFASAPENEFAEIEWDTSSRYFRKLAGTLMNEIRTLRFMPDFSAWKNGAFGWKLPNSELAEDSFAQQWLSLALMDWVTHDHELQETWQDIIQTYPLITSEAQPWIVDEDDWLQKIGWKLDNTPFTVGLRLVEPAEEGEAWQLDTILCAKDGDEWIDWHDIESIPDEWKAYLDAIEREQRIWTIIVPWLGDQNGHLLTTLTDEQAWLFLTSASEELLKAGVRIFLPSWWETVKHSKLTVKAKVKSAPKAGTSLLGLQALVDFDWRFATNGVELSEEEFAALVAQKQRLVKVRGQWLQLDPAFIQQIQTLMKKAKKEGLHIRDVLEQKLLQKEAAEWSADEDTRTFSRISIELNRGFQTFIRQLTEIERIPRIDVPERFCGTLRPYQKQGVEWLLFLRRFGLGACLADDMGLGKTVQMIAYLLYVKEHEKEKKPALLICPTSVLGNWQKEFAKFTPSLDIYVHYGANRAKEEAFTEIARQADVVLTSYGLSHLDFAELSQMTWGTICLDEAQNIKNAHTKQAKAIRKLEGFHKIALSGTPMENRLSELWSIFDFLNPGYLGSLTQFQRRFVTPIEKDRDTEKVNEIQKLIRPFLLRRTKTDEAIALNLPDKLEQKEYCPLTAEQASLYEELVQDTLSRIETLTGFERRGLILQMLNRLKQLCNHPALYLKEQQPKQVVERSNKLEKLIELVEQIRANHESCLIFTQYIQMGEMIQQLLESKFKEQVLFLNGSTSKQERDQMIEQFQAGKFHIFILSLKAGGTGLNLTAANHVIHFDRWWNPAVENQATDRAYRIGQTKFVHVHKLITLGTLEEKIDELIERKQVLNEQIIQSDHWITELSNEELRELLILPDKIGKGA